MLSQTPLDTSDTNLTPSLLQFDLTGSRGMINHAPFCLLHSCWKPFLLWFVLFPKLLWLRVQDMRQTPHHFTSNNSFFSFNLFPLFSYAPLSFSWTSRSLITFLWFCSFWTSSNFSKSSLLFWSSASLELPAALSPFDSSSSSKVDPSTQRIPSPQWTIAPSIFSFNFSRETSGTSIPYFLPSTSIEEEAKFQ